MNEWLETSTFSPEDLPSPVLVNEWLVADAANWGERIEWCECCARWITYEDSAGMWLPTCWCA